MRNRIILFLMLSLMVALVIGLTFCISNLDFDFSFNKNSSVEPSLTRKRLYGQDFRVFIGKPTYQFFENLSECKKYTTPVNNELVFVIFPSLTREKTEIAGYDGNYCHVVNYLEFNFGGWSKSNEFMLPIDFSRDLGVFLGEYFKNPETRIQNKEQLYSKLGINKNDSYGDDFDKLYSQIAENSTPYNLRKLNSYIIEKYSYREK